MTAQDNSNAEKDLIDGWTLRTVRAIMGNSSVGVFETAPDGRVVMANDACGHLLGYRDGKDLCESVRHVATDLYVSEEDRKAFVREVLTKGKASNYVVQMKVRGDGIVSVSMTAQALYDDDGNLERIVGLVVDVSALKEMQHALEISEARYRDIFDNTVVGIYQTSLDGTLLNGNPAFVKRFLGYETLDEALEHGHVGGTRLYVEEGLREKLIEEVLEKGAVENHVSRIRMRDGTLKWVSENARAVYDDNGRFLFFEGSFADITERVTIQQQLQGAIASAEISNRAKSEFLANMSHELRTPLNAIIGFSDIMKNELFGELANDRYRAYLGDIHDSARMLLQLIEDILDISKSEAGILRIEAGEVDLCAIAQSCTRLLKEKARNQNIELKQTIPGTPVRMQGDERRLRQIIINLLSNAIKFTNDGGMVEISVSRTEAGDAMLQVKDTGVGIPQSDFESIFKPFVQLDSGLAKASEGAGLGLPLVKKLIDLHQGTLELESEVGRGTSIPVIFPNIKFT